MSTVLLIQGLRVPSLVTPAKMKTMWVKIELAALAVRPFKPKSETSFFTPYHHSNGPRIPSRNASRTSPYRKPLEAKQIRSEAPCRDCRDISGARCRNPNEIANPTPHPHSSASPTTPINHVELAEQTRTKKNTSCRLSRTDVLNRGTGTRPNSIPPPCRARCDPTSFIRSVCSHVCSSSAHTSWPSRRQDPSLSLSQRQNHRSPLGEEWLPRRLLRRRWLLSPTRAVYSPWEAPRARSGPTSPYRSRRRRWGPGLWVLRPPWGVSDSARSRELWGR